MSFAPRQRIRCVRREPWLDWGERRVRGPAFDETCTVTAVDETSWPPGVFLKLEGWEGIFDAAYFEPVEDGADA